MGITPDGWFKTGDITDSDAEGFLTIIDRRKELVKYKVRAGSRSLDRVVDPHFYRVFKASGLAWHQVCVADPRRRTRSGTCGARGAVASTPRGSGCGCRGRYK